MNYKIFKTKKESGYTLLFAVLVSSLVLGVGISILSISKKEFQLSASARDSSVAFYSADSGIECAIYHEFNTNSSLPFIRAESSTLSCGGQEFNVFPSGSGALVDPNDSLVTEFEIKTGSGNSTACAIVVVDKYVDENSVTRTEINSYGYNVGWDSDSQTCDVSSPKRVERLLTVTY